MTKKRVFNPIELAVLSAGTQQALADRMGVRQPTIYRWLKAGIVPPRKVLLFEKVTGIPRHKLNPDIYPE